MENAEFSMHWLDYTAFFGYIALLSFVGWWTGRKKGNSEDYFLAGRSLPWYVVGSSYIASNISVEHFVGMIGAAVLYGICVATPEWSTIIAFTFMIWLFIPFLMSSKVFTATEFLERRFNRKMRMVFAVITILANVLLFMGPVVYGGSLLLSGLFNVPSIPAIIIIGIVAGAWAVWGGLKSVAFMDVVTIIFKIGGGITVSIVGLYVLGDGNIITGFDKMLDVNLAQSGWAKDWVSKNVPNMLSGAQQGEEYHRMSVVQPINQVTNPWTHWVFSFFYIGLWYTVINQHLIQKVLAAKDMYHARMGMVFASFLKLIVPAVVVLPGLIFFAMHPDFLNGNDWGAMSESANGTYIIMVRDYVPVFLVGILMAAFFSAIQSTVSSALNSTSTIFTLDFYSNYINKNASEDRKVKIGKLSGVFILGITIAIAVLIDFLGVNLFVYIQEGYTFIGPPFSAVFLLAMLWKRVNGKDALITVFATFGLAAILKFFQYTFLDAQVMLAFDAKNAGNIELYNSLIANLSGAKLTFLSWYSSLAGMFSHESMIAFAKFIKPFGNQGLICWIFAMLTCTISAFITPPAKAEQVGEGLVFSIKDKRILKEGLGTRWYNSVTLWWSIAFGIMVVLILIFSVFIKN